MLKTTPLALICLTLAACGPSDNDPGPGGISIGEARALDEAAEMIEARRLPQTPPEEQGVLAADEDNGQAEPQAESE